MFGSAPAFALLPASGRGVEIAQGVLAIAATALLLWRRDCGTRGRKPGRLHEVLLALCGLAGLAAWSSFGQFHFNGYLHDWDSYHYYIGAKYLPELQYTRLYDCSVVAEATPDPADPPPEEPRLIRDLATNELIPASKALEDPQRCTSHFSAERWQQFRADLEFFKRRSSPERWAAILRDHGFNGTPVWAVAGHLLTNFGPATHAQLLALTCLDLVLLAAMWICLSWGFGWRAACVCAVAFGTDYPARFAWTGGSLLRFDWLCALACGIACLKRGKNFWAGFLLGASALLRVFPAFALAAALLVGLRRALGLKRSPARPPCRLGSLGPLGPLLGGAALAALLGVGLSIAVPGRNSTGLWSNFARNSSKHLATPLTNNLGLRALIFFHPLEPWKDDPAAKGHENQLWRDERAKVVSARWPLYALVLLASLALLAWVFLREEIWISAILGVAFVPFAVDLTCYYFVFLLLLGLLWTRSPAIGIALCAHCAVQSIAGLLIPESFLLGAVQSGAIVSLCLFSAAALARTLLRLRLPAAGAAP